MTNRTPERMDDWAALNRSNWDERAAVHLGDGGYDLASHRAGMGVLDAIVAAELGDVAGRRVLHLQCHIGHDSIALAHRGADVTGVDFSPASIDAARALAHDCGVADRTRFALAGVDDAPQALAQDRAAFDLVFTTWGTICWLPDVARWATVIAELLRPGGRLYFADAHPVALIFDDSYGGRSVDDAGRPAWLLPYFERSAQTFDDPTDYADADARLANSRTVQWMHPLADILGALGAAGLRLDWLHEHPSVPWRMFASLVPQEGGLWTWPDRQWLPLAVSLQASKPA